MFRRKGQITIFILLALIILILSLFLIFYYKSDKENNITTIDTNIVPTVRNYVVQCIKTTIKEGIFENGLRGGYFYLPKNSTKGIAEKVPFYKYEKINLVPELNVFQKHLSYYIDSFLPFCLKNLDSFKDQGYSVQIGKSNSVVSVTEKGISVKTKLPIVFSQNEKITTIETFSTVINDQQLYENIQLSKDIVQSVKNSSICITCYIAQAQKNNAIVNFYPFYNNTYIFDIEDTNYIFEGGAYHLQFALKYETNK